MKAVKWKILILTCITCLLPILLGLALWDKLPQSMAIHFNFQSQPDNYAPKAFVVFGLPALMALLQAVLCITNDINTQENNTGINLERFVKWIVPCLTVCLQVITLGYGLGWNLDIRRSVGWLLGVLFLVIGYFMRDLQYVKNKNVDAKQARQINRFSGLGFMVMGALFIISTFLQPWSTIACLVLMILHGISISLFSIYITRK